MKVNTNITIPAANEPKPKQDKKDKIQSGVVAKDSSVVISAQKNLKLNSYQISPAESEIIMSALKDSFSNMEANIENLFSEISGEKVYSLLRENN